jgi:flagellar hook-associated protein 2
MEATVSVRQGFAGSLYDTVDQTLRAGSGRVPIAQDSINEQIDRIEKRIEDEEKRLEGVESRLTAKFARMEKMLSMIQQQMAGLSNL